MNRQNFPNQRAQSAEQLSAAASRQTAHDVLQSLNEDKVDLQTMLELLKQERSALEQRDHQAVQTLSEQKGPVVERLEQRNTARQARLLPHQPAPDAASWRQAIESLESSSGLPLLGVWNDVESALHDCRTSLQINEKIVGGMQNSVNQFLNTLRGEIGAGQTYSASGKASTFTDTKNFTSA